MPISIRERGTAHWAFTGAVQDLPAYTKGGSELLVFAIPKEANVQANAVDKCHANAVQ